MTRRAPRAARTARFAALAAALAATAALAAVPGASAAPAASAASARAAAPAIVLDMEAGPWANRVCSAILDWSNAAGTREKALEKSLGAAKTLATARALLSRYLDQMVGETDRMVTRVDAAGTPAVKSGPQIRQRLRSLLTKARQSIADGRAASAKLSLTDSDAFSAGAGKIGDTIGAQFDALGKGFDALDTDFPSPALDKAVSASKACQSI